MYYDCTTPVCCSSYQCNHNIYYSFSFLFLAQLRTHEKSIASISSVYSFHNTCAFRRIFDVTHILCHYWTIAFAPLHVLKHGNLVYVVSSETVRAKLDNMYAFSLTLFLCVCVCVCYSLNKIFTIHLMLWFSLILATKYLNSIYAVCANEKHGCFFVITIILLI